MRIGIMVPDLVANDAVGTDALGMYLSLLHRGVESYLFTQSGHAKTPLAVFHYSDVELLLSSVDDVLIYHYCICDDIAMSLMRRVACRVIIKYHNVTPARFTMAYSAEYSMMSRAGREWLQELGELAITAIMSDSEYNAGELRKVVHPLTKFATVPPFHRAGELTSTLDDTKTLASVKAYWFNILVVGRIVPNKGLEVLLSSFALAMKSVVNNVHLHVVGVQDSRLDGYLRRLDAIITENALAPHVTWYGSVSSVQLATLYRHCDLFWTASMHEGFCVSVVEAMAFGLPILASSQGALPETCGAAAIYADKSHACVAALSRLITNDGERIALGKMGVARYLSNFRGTIIDRHFHAALEQIRIESEKRIKASSLVTSDDWFGIPEGMMLIRAALEIAEPMHPAALTSRDRRLDFVDWIFREGWRQSSQVADYLRTKDFEDYAREIELPVAADYFAPCLRLRWRFSRFANSYFDLRLPEDVSAFVNWCLAEPNRAYKFPVWSLQQETA